MAYRLRETWLRRGGKVIGPIARTLAKREGREMPQPVSKQFALRIAEDRRVARALGDFAEADALRGALAYDGWIVEDIR